MGTMLGIAGITWQTYDTFTYFQENKKNYGEATAYQKTAQKITKDTTGALWFGLGLSVATIAITGGLATPLVAVVGGAAIATLEVKQQTL